jgi:hypothetical protein
VRARVVVAASGQSSLILDRLGLREWDPLLKKATIWTYWKGAYRDEGRNSGATMVLRTQGKKGWFWYIPLADDVISVDVVAAHDYLFQNRGTKDLETLDFEEVARCPGLQPRLANAERCDIFRAQKEYSYRSRQAAGDGWVLVGDWGLLAPEAMAWLIRPPNVDAHGQVSGAIKAIAQLGFVLYMFVIGLRLHSYHMKHKTHATIAVSHASIVVPMVLGAMLAVPLYSRYSYATVPFSSFALILGVAMAITAFPVLARILSDRGLDRTPLGAVALACAAADDATAWCFSQALLVMMARWPFSPCSS